LAHFLAHTSRLMGDEPTDWYVWQVGIPNLALRSEPLMHSVLALAAMCRCSDVIAEIAGGPVPMQQITAIQELMVTAEAHHALSLNLTRSSLDGQGIEAEADYDIVLANAMVMVPYAFVFRRLRTWLAKHYALDPTEEPSSSWILLCRAVGLAILGLRAKDNKTSGDTTQASASVQHTPPGSPGSACNRSESANFFCEGKESKPTAPLRTPIEEHVLYPIICATAPAALRNLSSRVKLLLHESDDAVQTSCSEAVSVLERISSDLRSAQSAYPAACETVDTDCPDHTPLGGMTDVVGWLQRSLGRHAHIRSGPQKGLTRVVLSFLSRGTTSYISLLIDVLDSTSGENPMRDTTGLSDDGGICAADSGGITIEQRIVLEIFVHWLVFLLLLDGIWWVQDLGIDELGHVVSQINNSNLAIWPQETSNLQSLSRDMAGTSLEDDWWPASICRIAMEVNRHRSEMEGTRLGP
jgi:hypothetical protein